ncbi:SDR family oxidoreductase [Mycobacteroides abscessus]|uniref:SDR family oxidoreductase n=1 Tax=Mycobacteroides abscessus TaxID=36809 RepID=UPI003F65D379
MDPSYGGGNRGIGRVIIEEFKRRGAGKIYAGVRDTSTIVDPEIVPLELDITDPASVQIAAANASDVEIVVNNAGLLIATSALGADLDDARRQLEVNYLGTLSMAQAFAPVIEENGGGVIVNLLSSASWVAGDPFSTYGASKAAQWSITNALRQELEPRGIDVSAVHVSFVDTDMCAKFTQVAKTEPRVVAEAIADGIVAGSKEIFVDQYSKDIKATLSASHAPYL